MPLVRVGDADIAYDEYGSGFPLLLFAPGGMYSRSEFWAERPGDWIDPRKTLSDRYRVIAMDQRNAGRSRAPIRATDGWHSYAADAVGLVRHLGIRSLAVMGGCIGVSFALGFCARREVEVRAAVLQNPVGRDPNDEHDHFGPMLADWSTKFAAAHPEVTDDALAGLGKNMFGGEFVLSVDREFVRSFAAPMLVLPGNDNFHPTATAEEIARLAPHATLVRSWRPSQIGDGPAVELIRNFLESSLTR